MGLTVVLAAVERFGRSYAQDEIAGRLQAGGITGEVDVRVGRSWWQPSVVPALLTGDLDGVSIAIRNGSVAGMRVDRVDYVLSGIRGDVSLLNGTVVVRSIARGTVDMRIPPEVLTEGIGLPVDIRGGRLVAGDPPSQLRAVVVGDALVLSGPPVARLGSPPTIPIVDPYVLPCRPEVGIVGRDLVLSCAGNRIPGILQAPLQGNTPSSSDPAPQAELPPPQSIERPGG